jgi:hypothetical protein
MSTSLLHLAIQQKDMLWSARFSFFFSFWKNMTAWDILCVRHSICILFLIWQQNELERDGNAIACEALIGSLPNQYMHL